MPQTKITFYTPPCNPTWNGGNNGGSTMTGVDSTQIRYVYFVTQANAQVNAILSEENLTATAEQTCSALQAWNSFINKNWQLYGRKFVSLDGPGNNAGSKQQSSCNFPYFQSQCSSSPPDPTCYRAEADAIAAMKPAFVLTPDVDSSLDVRLAQDHVITISNYDAGPIFPEQYYSQLAPYLYGLNNGTQQAEMFAEFWCKDLADRPVQWAGTTVEHPNGNPLSTPPNRKLMIFYAEGYAGDPTDQISANLLKSLVTGGQCGKPGDAITDGYSSDITTGAEQSDTTVATAESDHITDVTCLCDPIAPAVSSTTFEDQNYQPEMVLMGNGLLDYDPLAQLYNQDVWRHAFGLSNIGNAQPFAQTDAVAAWHSVGNSGEPDQTENLSLIYFETMADDAEVAGPNVNTSTIHTGLMNAAPLGGDPYHPLAKYTPQNPWDAFQDVRLVYYCPTTTSQANGKPGAYIPLYGGKRFKMGQIPTNAPFFPSGLCAP